MIIRGGEYAEHSGLVVVSPWLLLNPKPYMAIGAVKHQ